MDVYFCDICDFITEEKESFEEHTLSQLNCFKYKCNFCIYKSSLEDNLSDHVKTNHNKEESKQTLQDNLSDHKANHKEEKESKETTPKDKNKLVLHSNFFLTCNDCDYITKHQYKLQKHQESKCFSFQCDLCQFKTSLAAKYKRHNVDNHSDVTSFKCEKCDFECADRRKFVSHKSMNDCYRFTCDVCNFKTSIQANLINHNKENHGDGKKYVCHSCDFKSDKKQKLEQHLLGNTCYRYYCTNCEFKSSHRNIIKSHNETLHNTKEINFYKNRGAATDDKNSRYKCDDCGYAAAFKYLIERHKNRKHKNIADRKIANANLNVDKFTTAKSKKKTKFKSVTTINKLSCKQCDFQTKYDENLQKHLAGFCFRYTCNICKFKTSLQHKLTDHYNEEHFDAHKFKCDECKFGTSHNYMLERHKQRKHNGEKHACSDCDFQSTLQDALYKHRKKIHNDPGKKGRNRQEYPCPICNLSISGNFRYRKHLFSHKIYHKDSSFLCTDCDNSETDELSANKHAEIHNLEYKCSQCQVTFTHFKSFTIHLKTKHNDSKDNIHKCDQCGYSTRRRDAMRRHKKQTHEKIRAYCGYCGYNIVDKRWLKGHIEKKHPDKYDEDNWETKVYHQKSMDDDNDKHLMCNEESKMSRKAKHERESKFKSNMKPKRKLKTKINMKPSNVTEENYEGAKTLKSIKHHNNDDDGEIETVKDEDNDGEIETVKYEDNDEMEIVQLDDADDEIEIVKSTVQKKENWEVTVSDIFNARGINFAYGSSKPAGTLPLPRPRA